MPARPSKRSSIDGKSPVLEEGEEEEITRGLTDELVRLRKVVDDQGNCESVESVQGDGA